MSNISATAPKLRHPPASERVIADVALDTRTALVVEQRLSGKLVIWQCRRNPAGQTVLTSATRAFSVPFGALGKVWPIFQRIDTEAHRENLRRAS